MNLQELKKEAYKLSVIDRLALVEAIIRSLSNELRPRTPVTDEVWEQLRGGLKTETPPPSDAEIEVMLQERLEEKYL
ncbi:hypothetical protein [Microseira wollei]|uniref:Addiction module component n=1 Tax=Microseira wollei NIES-4236 TaxID=2530354 RepID=A0AAV3XKX2_9CYAN|nr:hypothetical protein [Microseira wollei]GET42223.1 hypothetical protein MiSe_70370 [Microseira wollei NIES-4236]